MRISLNWLKKHLKTKANINEISEKLTSIGLEVEFIKDKNTVFKNFKLVKIIDAQKHPDADKLQICKAQDCEDNIHTIVCGAPNARTGIVTVLATPGAFIPSTNSVLKAGKIRGIVSEGMMCSYTELCMDGKSDGIIELDVALNSDIGDTLGLDGGIIDISITPNRGDCLSVNGIARDLSATCIGEFLGLNMLNQQLDNGDFFNDLNNDCNNNFKDDFSCKSDENGLKNSHNNTCNQNNLDNVLKNKLKRISDFQQTTANDLQKNIDSVFTDCIDEKDSISKDIKIKFNLDNENFIYLMAVKNIDNSKIVQQLKRQLSAIDVNSISMIVDLANWWMFTTGQPLHVYDLKKINGEINFRYAKDGEQFTDIKGNTHTLNSSMMVSADEKNVLCVLGIMGGQFAMCDENTTDILIESAFFDKISIAKTATTLNLFSDSRARFERGIDYNLQKTVLNLFLKSIVILNKNCNFGHLLKIGNNLHQCECNEPSLNNCTPALVDHTNPHSNEIIFSKKQVENILGYEINKIEIINILNRLGIKQKAYNEISNRCATIEINDDELIFQSPSWRWDISIPQDLIEEILRINGYHNVVEKPLNCFQSVNNFDISAHKTLANLGFSEIISYSFINEKNSEIFKENKKLISVQNPISSDLSVMRPSLIPGLLCSIKKTLNVGENTVALFECGNVFSYKNCLTQTHVNKNCNKNALPNFKNTQTNIKDSDNIQNKDLEIYKSENIFHQELHISGTVVANKSKHWLNNQQIDVFFVKNALLDVLSTKGILERDIKIICENLPTYYHPARSGLVEYKKEIIGVFGQLHPKANQLMDIKEEIYLFEVFLDKIKAKTTNKTYSDKFFPYINRDFAFTFKSSQNVGNTINEIYKLDNKILNVSVFDNFKLSETEKSIAFSVKLGCFDRTLTDEESCDISNKIITFINNNGGNLRE